MAFVVHQGDICFDTPVERLGFVARFALNLTRLIGKGDRKQPFTLLMHHLGGLWYPTWIPGLSAKVDVTDAGESYMAVLMLTFLVLVSKKLPAITMALIAPAREAIHGLESRKAGPFATLNAPEK